MLPIETVVDLLMSNALGRSRFRGSVSSSGKWEVVVGVGQIITADDRDELREKIRAHLQSLVPPPKLLSECEEGVEFYGVFGRPSRYTRDGKFAVDSDGRFIGDAEAVQVIQPVEVK